ncbi:MAG: plasmid replication initiator TrfA [Rhodocyclaceae bacterium]|nr:plasmid replication initiator TrfA [Rhodocyclaceae bacterium]
MAKQEDTALQRKRTEADIAASLARAKARGKAAETATVDLPALMSMMGLPQWPDAVRGVPNGFLRSALFAALGRGVRRYMERELIAALEGVEIRYTGPQLDQGELDVWSTVLHLARKVPDFPVAAKFFGGLTIKVTAYELLKMLGKTDAGDNRKTLDKRLSRLNATALDVKIAGQGSYEGSLIEKIYRAEDSRAYVIVIDPKISGLFAGDQFTQVDWKVRRELDGHPLAQWLHGFYATHAKPYPMRVQTLLKLAGSSNGDPYSAAQKLRKALTAVANASQLHLANFSYSILGDLVHVEKSSRKHKRKTLS